jgi:AcrR family transcriptional regulator
VKNEQGIGIRDRKRAETRARLEDAAVTLVLRDGLENTTIDAISELADVSPRTFFNYFDSKDSAVLGMQDAEVSEELVARHLATTEMGDPAASVVRLLVSVMGAALIRFGIHEDRMEIVQRYPQLLAGKFAQMMQMAGRMSSAVQEILEREPAFAGKPAEQAAWAEVLVATCTSAVRVAAKEWVSAGGDTSTDDVEPRAIELVREVLEKLP